VNTARYAEVAGRELMVSQAISSITAVTCMNLQSSKAIILTEDHGVSTKPKSFRGRKNPAGHTVG
jgi:hypothetical protein